MSVMERRFTPSLLRRGVLPMEVRTVAEHAALSHSDLYEDLAVSPELSEDIWYTLYQAGKKTPADLASKLAGRRDLSPAQVRYVLDHETRSLPLESLVARNPLTVEQTRILGSKRAFAQFGCETLLNQPWADAEASYEIARDRGGKALLFWLVRFGRLLSDDQMVELFSEYASWAPPTRSSEARTVAWNLLGPILASRPVLNTPAICWGSPDLLGVVASSHLLFDETLQARCAQGTGELGAEDLASAGERMHRLATNPLCTPAVLDLLAEQIPTGRRLAGPLHAAWSALTHRRRYGQGDDHVSVPLAQASAEQLPWLIRHGWSRPGWASWAIAAREILANPHLEEAVVRDNEHHHFYDDLAMVVVRPFFEHHAARDLGDDYDRVLAQVFSLYPEQAQQFADNRDRRMATPKPDRARQNPGPRLEDLLAQSNADISRWRKLDAPSCRLLGDHLSAQLGTSAVSWDALFSMELTYDGPFGELVELCGLLGRTAA